MGRRKPLLATSGVCALLLLVCAVPTPEAARKKHKKKDLPDAASAAISGDCPEPSDNLHRLLGVTYKLRRDGLLDAALACIAKASAAEPKSAEVAVMHGNVLSDRGDRAGAIKRLRHASQLQDDLASAHSTLAAVLQTGEPRKHELAAAENALKRALELWPQPSAEAVYDGNSLGMLQSKLGRVEDAVETYSAALKAGPAEAAVYNNLGNALRSIGSRGEAAVSYSEAVKITPGHPLFRYNLALTLMELGRESDAEGHLREAVKLRGDLYEARVTLAEVLAKKSPREAEEHAAAAVELRPSAPRPWFWLGEALAEQHSFAQSLRAYRRSYLVVGDNLSAEIDAFYSALWMEQFLCEWDQWDARAAALPSLVARELASLEYDESPGIRPLQALLYLPAPELAQVTRGFAQWVTHAAAGLPGAQGTTKKKTAKKNKKKGAAEGGGGDMRGSVQPGGRLHVGYVSADFGNHPVGQLVRGVFGMHDRSRFKVFCYGLAPDDGTEYRRQVEEEADVFVDVSAMDPVAIADLVQGHGVHVLFDLMGYTKRGQPKIFALRPAPIQVSFMGWPASTFAPAIDYILADRAVAPPHLVPGLFSEKVIYLPGTYYVSDYNQTTEVVALEDVGEVAAVRAREGLPEEGLVLCSFNQHYKIDPAIFAVWANILRRLPGSVLWLLEWGGHASQRLKDELAAAGVHPSRLILGRTADKKEHMRRAGAADIFMDTLLYGGHTSATDALWAGVPVVTAPGDKMVTRVATSLLGALGMGPGDEHSTVVGSLREYEDLVVALGSDPPRLAAMRARVRGLRRAAGRLFDTGAWVRSLEAALAAAWARHDAGAPPGHVVVGGGTGGGLPMGGGGLGDHVHAAPKKGRKRKKGDRVEL